LISRSTSRSWINQIEIWFSILVRELLRRGNFTSKDHLKQRIETFLACVNATMAKPFSWTMKRKPLSRASCCRPRADLLGVPNGDCMSCRQ
jgi:hypothetical protein